MNLEGRRIAVTGATGFIGRALVSALALRGARAVAVVRDPRKVEGGIEARRADLADVGALTSAFEGCDAVIANAGLVSIGWQSRDALIRANVEGTRNVFDAARRAGVGRVVMTSSATAYARQRGRAYEENDPLWSEDARVSRPLYYAVSKAMAEREAWRLAEEHGIDLSVARPSGVYGEGDYEGLTPWIERLGRVPLVTAFPAYVRLPMVYVGDLAEAMLRMLERPIASGRAYNVTGGPDVTLWRMMAAYREAGGRVAPIVVPIPVPVRFAYSIERARRELDFENRPLAAAFTEILARRG